MLIALHKNATTTPAIGRAIQHATGSDVELAEQFNVGRDTIRKWRNREGVQDASHTPHRLQTTLNAGQEELVVYLRQQLRLPLDDLLAAIHEFIEPSMSRSALARLLRRRSVSSLPEPVAPARETQPFKAYEPGYVHVDVKYLPQMQDETERRYVFVAIDRATRWVFIVIKHHRTAKAARSFLNALAKAAPFKIRTILTDNGTEFTDRLFGSRARQPSGEHEFDGLCQALDIEHRLTKPKTPQTNGMVERFNGRLEQVLRTHRFNSAEDLETTLHRYVWLYNAQLPQKALAHLAPLQALTRWQRSHPALSVRRHGHRVMADQPSQSLDVVGHALERDRQLVPGQRRGPHHLAAQLLQPSEHVLDSRSNPVGRGFAKARFSIAPTIVNKRLRDVA